MAACWPHLKQKYNKKTELPQRCYELKNFVGTFIGSIGTKAHKNFVKSSRTRTQGLSKIFRAPYIGRIARSTLR